MQDQQALFDFVAQAKARYDTVLEQLRARVGTQERGTPDVEVLHVYGNMNELHSAHDAIGVVERFGAIVPEAEGKYTADALQRRIDQHYFKAYTKLNQFAYVAELSAMRMQAWESKEAFTAADWPGETPSEAVTGLAASIQTFFSEHPALVEQLKACQGARPGLMDR